MQKPLHYRSTGNDLPLFFQHGLGSNLDQAFRLLGDLADVQLISMDCPGHGGAPLPEGLMPSFDYYTDELLRLMSSLGIDRAVFGGISMGSGIALNMALNYPDKVKGLVLVRPAWLDAINPENLALLLEAADRIPLHNGLDEFEQLPEFKQIKEQLPKAAQSILGVFCSYTKARNSASPEKHGQRSSLSGNC